MTMPSNSAHGVLSQLCGEHVFADALSEIMGVKAGSVCPELTGLLEVAASLRNPAASAQVLSRLYLLLETALEILNGNITGRKMQQLKKLVNAFKRETLSMLVAASTIGALDNTILDATRLLREEIKIALKEMNYTVLSVKASTKSRVAIGEPLTPLEIMYSYGTKLHPILGIPYIPGSSLKGAFKAYISLANKKCNVVDTHELLEQWFGSQERKGLLVFADAYPVFEGTKLLLEPDVTTPIYADGTAEPRIEEHRARPIPVIYPVIARNVRFEIIIGIGSGVDPTCIQRLHEWLGQLLVEGIGAKTSLGYGVLVSLGYEIR